MKKILFTICLCLAISFVFAQTDNRGFSFQGYAIDPDGKALSGTQITVRFTVYSSTVTFTEEHSTNSDAFGVFHAIVGNSTTAKNDEFSLLDFTKKDANYSLKVEVKKSGGSYTTISDQPMNAVPYARYASNGVPVGTIIAWGGDDVNKIPGGWKLCDGTSVLKTDYPQLYQIIGDVWGTSGASFNLPDLRGVFLRGVNGSRNDAYSDPDNSRIIGTLQGDEFKSHAHQNSVSMDGGHSHIYKPSYGDDNPNDPGKSRRGNEFGNGSGDGVIIGPNVSTSYENDHKHTVTIQPSGGNETRPKNAAVYYIIKY